MLWILMDARLTQCEELAVGQNTAFGRLNDFPVVPEGSTVGECGHLDCNEGRRQHCPVKWDDDRLPLELADELSQEEEEDDFEKPEAGKIQGKVSPVGASATEDREVSKRWIILCV